MRSLDLITRATRRMAVALGCVVALGACTRWIDVPTPAPAAHHRLGGPVRVTRHDGVPVTLSDPFVQGDTLYGNDEETPVAVALRDVQTTRLLEVDSFRGFAVVGIAAVAGMVLYALAPLLPIHGN